jgi:methionyl-tRNA formyltransferase
MRVVFMGTPQLSVASLRALARVHDVVAVYTRADAASGRGKTLIPSPVKVAAAELDIPVRTPATLRDPAEHVALRALDADMIIVAAYGMILPPEVLTAARLGAVNVHASLLPRWRGAAPIQRAILAGDDYAGVAIMRMEEGLDTGPYCLVAATPVGVKNTETLTAEIAEMGAELLLDALEEIESGEVVWAEQDDEFVTYAEKITKADVALSPALSAQDTLRRVRASSAQAPARASIEGRGVTVLSAESASAVVEVPAGTVRVLNGHVHLGLCDGAIVLGSIKPDGKAAMAAPDWLRGLRLEGDGSWEATS